LEPEFEGTFLLGPNPSHGETNLNYDLPLGHAYQWELTDLSGRVIRQEKLGQLNGSLNLQLANSGLYFVRLLQDGRSVAVEKLTVIR
jgi:hypothetical protein